MNAAARTAAILLILTLVTTGCERPSQPTPTGTPIPITPATPTLASTSTATATATATGTPTSTPTATPFFTAAVTDCGQILPILSNYAGPVVTSLDPDPQALANLQAIVPDEARAALNQLLTEPGLVGLAAYRVGQEADGAYLNADVPMPLASVVKVIDLVAYAEAVAAGQLDPTTTVALADLEVYYLPNLDLNAHPKAVANLENNGRVFGDPPSILLDEVPGMMIEFSSNAATDYLHMLLGQTVIEETAVSLNLASQAAPCPWVGQFLAMGNHTRALESDEIAIQNYINDPASYGHEVMLLTEAFSTDPDFRQTAIDWRQETRRPNGQTQRLFSDTLNAQGSTRDYAGLMARIALNGLSNGDSSFIARRYLEWVMRFTVNQELFSNLGYKGGSLPGILTTVYYAYPIGEDTPVVVALFYRGLNGRTYQQWRDNLTYDELARWLLYDPAAIPAIKAVLE
ncbi:MAG: serine hydrolase [Ardenticatenaceae bacterium]|nr:serine hydrolase [Ardenticatenaceae bacterium]MCB9443515.1 serine hydrolase [Ardenticatenaceae bacterium]